MTAPALLDAIRACGCTVTADAGDLVIRGPRGALSPELRARLAAGKAAVLEALAHSQPLAENQPLALEQGVAEPGVGEPGVPEPVVGGPVAGEVVACEPWDDRALVDLYRSMLDRISLADTQTKWWDTYLDRLEQAEKYRSTAALTRVAEDFERWLATRSTPASTPASTPVHSADGGQRGRDLFEVPAEGATLAPGLPRTNADAQIDLGDPPIQPEPILRDFEHAAGRGVGRDGGRSVGPESLPTGLPFVDSAPDNAPVRRGVNR